MRAQLNQQIRQYQYAMALNYQSQHVQYTRPRGVQEVTLHSDTLCDNTKPWLFGKWDRPW